MPQHTRLLCERLLDAYCARICPPGVRHAVEIGYSIAADHVTIHEWRPICGVPGTRRALPVALLRWSSQDNLWRLFHAGDDRGWQRVADCAASHRFIELLRSLDADRSGQFFGHVDGKSLRWCSSRGRCAGCEEQYSRVLGLSADEPNS